MMRSRRGKIPSDSEAENLNDSDDDFVVSHDDLLTDTSSESTVKSDDDEYSSAPHPSNQKRQPKIKKVYKWIQVPAGQNLLPTPEFNPPPRVVEEVGRLIHYFKLFFTDELLQHITKQTNLYATQLDANEPFTLTHQELEVILGTVIYTSVLGLSRSGLFWKHKYRIPQVADAMRRRRWKIIKSHLHFNDKSNLPTDRIDPNYDKLFKIRPVLDHLLHIFQNKEKHQKL
ncbi:hypothetical protein ILUMI_04377 [Ignelater luminosus]|uniref:PiggyBac transposable element-derived protein domain-containing protein n=1 Tax=Ignelater luminosus TaxID=2038154 RepID=A0A8K0D989_IGNLU|nr:hypothetical protein ILUMI_04377 [Ignelater luminosus]